MDKYNWVMVTGSGDDDSPSSKLLNGVSGKAGSGGCCG